jgi:ABC-type Mn2+/Zn2+ transport system ATPase subunit
VPFLLRQIEQQAIMKVPGEQRSRRGLALIVITHDIPLGIRQTSTVLRLNKAALLKPVTTTVKADGHHRL